MSREDGADAMIRAEIPGTVLCDYAIHRPSGPPRELILLLHGYRQSGAYCLRKFAESCPADAVLLAPSGPYPMPERRPEGGYRVGYSWYFYDDSRGEYFIDPSVAIGVVAGLVSRLGLEGLPKRIVGFSQGGYFAPLLASRLGGVAQVVGVASELLAEDLVDAGAPFPPSYPIDAIHGADDDIIPAARSQASHEKAHSLGAQGRFVLLPGVAHRIGPAMTEALGELLQAASLGR